MTNYVIHNGDSAEILKTLPENSVDAVVTDPPAAISFMGKKWDSDKGGRDQWIAWLRGIMAECLRCLKPGGHALVWAIPRTSHYTATALEDAGFEVRDFIVHLQSQGFPKSVNLGKAIDEHLGEDREVVGTRPDAAKLNKSVQEAPGGWVTSHRDPNLTAPASDEAKRWEGWGSALKPSAEFWVLCRKPLAEKTLVKNVIEWGAGGLNIEASRIPTTENLNGGAYAKTITERTDGWGGMTRGGAGEYQQPTGRFPSNCVFSHSPDCGDECADGCPVKSLDEQSGTLKSGAQGFKRATSKGHQANAYGKESRPPGTPSIAYADQGGASRFYKCLDADPFVYQAKSPKSEKNEGIDIPNNHPTVKSVGLCEYLIKLITPAGGTVLDPFAGSGSTGVAAVKNGFKFIGVEMDPHYFEICSKRISHFDQ